MKKISVLLILSLCVIFYMSNQTYEEQSIVPTLETALKDEPSKELLSGLEFNFWGTPISIETKGYHGFIEMLLRKATHFFGYGFVGVLFWLFYRRLQWKFPSLLAVFSIAIVASLDEYNQSLIPSRNGALQDVITDVLGAVTCIAIAHLLVYLCNRFKAPLFSGK